MQIVITLNSEEELKTFLANMAQGTQASQPAAVNPTATPVSATAANVPAAPKSAPAAASDPAPATVPAAAPAPAPEPKKPEPAKITKQAVQTKAIALMDQGKQQQLMYLLAKYNVPALPNLPDDQLAAFMADLEVL